MKKTVNYVYIALIFLTLSVAGISSLVGTKHAVGVIVLISLLKFNLVGFEFMELKKAHGFWKFMLIFYSLVISFFFAVLLI